MAPEVRRWLPAAVALTAVLIVAVLLVVNLGDDPRADPSPPLPSPTLSVAPLTPQTALRPEVAVLALVPHDAEYVTITDLDAIRARLGLPDLTRAELMSDRQAFWDRAERDAVLLTDGLLRADSSELWLDYDFTEDDVDWEARFTGQDGPGYVLAFRPGQDMAAVERAVEAGVGPLNGAAVRADLHLLVADVADPGEPVRASDPDLVGLVPDDEGPRETTYLRRGCIPFVEALGTDATVEDQDAVLARHDPTGLDPLPAMSLSFGDDVATAWFAPDRADLFDRADLVEGWPATGPVGFSDGFTGTPVVDPGSGRIGFQVANPLAAATLTLSEILPFGICNEVVPLDEPFETLASLAPQEPPTGL